MMYPHAASEPKREFNLGRSAGMAAMVLGLLASGASVQAATSAAASSAPAPSAQLPAAPANGEMGFVFSRLEYAVVPGKDACPTGTENMVRDNFLTTVPPAERARLMKPENEPELTAKWKAYGFSPDHRMNVCANFDKFDHPLYKGVQNKISYGVNLDGATSDKNPTDPYVCPHEKFTSPTGEKGIDNQTYRAIGCERNWRAADGGVGDSVIGAKQNLMGDYTVVMILRNVHSLVNDDNIEVILASSPDQAIADSQSNFIRDASYQVIDDARWRTVLHGHIHNGVLTTDPKDFVLQAFRRRGGVVAGPNGRRDWDFARSRIQVAFKPDGTLEGVIGGYTPLTMTMRQQIGGGAGTVTVADIDCNSQFRTVKAMADGDRDPVTGQCNRISAAWRVEAVPAFVFDHAPQMKTADAK